MIQNCPICDSGMSPDVLAATYHCTTCGFLASNLPVGINSIEAIDEKIREVGLRSLRLSGYSRVLDAIQGILPARAHVLDVGCAHGWFMQMAKERGYEPVGIEPDDAMAQVAANGGHNVIRGFFPDALDQNERFDAITFHDVFEHLPDVRYALRGVATHLRPGGHLVINIPISDGVIFRVSRLAARFGIRKPLSRMWQKGLPSPHLSYFSATNLRCLLRKEGFMEVMSGRLQAIETTGLRERIGYDKTMSQGTCAAIFIAATILRPVLNLFPSDIQFFVFRLETAD